MVRVFSRLMERGASQIVRFLHVSRDTTSSDDSIVNTRETRLGSASMILHEGELLPTPEYSSRSQWRSAMPTLLSRPRQGYSSVSLVAQTVSDPEPRVIELRNPESLTVIAAAIGGTQRLAPLSQVFIHYLFLLAPRVPPMEMHLGTLLPSCASATFDNARNHSSDIDSQIQDKLTAQTDLQLNTPSDHYNQTRPNLHVRHNYPLS